MVSAAPGRSRSQGVHPGTPMWNSKAITSVAVSTVAGQYTARQIVAMPIGSLPIHSTSVAPNPGPAISSGASTAATTMPTSVMTNARMRVCQPERSCVRS